MPSDTKRTAFVLVPGGFIPGIYFERVTSKLQELGYEVHEIDHPSVGKKKPDGPATLYDDANHVNDVVAGFVN